MNWKNSNRPNKHCPWVVPEAFQSQASGATALLAAHRARESEDRTVLSAASFPCSTPCVVGRYEQSVRSTVVERGWQQEVARACLRGSQQSGPLREPSTFDHPFVGSMMSPTANGA